MTEQTSMFELGDAAGDSLVRHNEHGDRWEEPSLFQQEPAGWTTTAPARTHHLEEWRRSGPDALGRLVLTAECHACRTIDPTMGETFTARAETEADCWRILESAHTARIQVTGD
ncbi:MAG: hypothetical protein WBS24_03410 [Terriglobales bacterium]